MSRAWTWFAVVALGACVGCAISDEGGLRWFWIVGGLSIALDIYNDTTERRINRMLRRPGMIR